MVPGRLKFTAQSGQIFDRGKICREIAERLQNNGDAVVFFNRRNAKRGAAKISVLEKGFRRDIFAVQGKELLCVIMLQHRCQKKNGFAERKAAGPFVCV